MEKPYSDLVAQAEKSVSGVKDPELRRVAFEKILDDLLSKASGEDAQAVSSKARVALTKPPAEREGKSKQGGPQAYVEELIKDGFFKKTKTISEVKVELSNLGHHIPLTSLSGPLQTLCKKKALRRQKTGGKGDKKTYIYSNW
jgi:hypothetical protein